MYQDLLSGLVRFYKVESVDGEALFGVPLPLAVAYGLFCTASFFMSGVVLQRVSATYRRLPKQAHTDWDNRMVALGTLRGRSVGRGVEVMGWEGAAVCVRVDGLGWVGLLTYVYGGMVVWWYYAKKVRALFSIRLETHTANASLSPLLPPRSE